VLVAKEVKSGQWKSRPLRFGLASGVIKVEWNPKLADRITPELKAELDKLQADIASGALVVPRGSF